MMDRDRRMAHWRQVIDQRKECYVLAREVRGAMAEALQDASRRVTEAEARAKQLQDAADALQELGVTPGYDRWSTKRKIEQALGANQAEDAVRRAVAALTSVLEEIERGKDAA
jgi:DnaJ-domain-containing protein 1